MGETSRKQLPNPHDMTPGEIEKELDALQRRGVPEDMGRIMALLRRKIDSRGGGTLAAAARHPTADPRNPINDPRETNPV